VRPAPGIPCALFIKRAMSTVRTRTRMRCEKADARLDVLRGFRVGRRRPGTKRDRTVGSVFKVRCNDRCTQNDGLGLWLLACTGTAAECLATILADRSRIACANHPRPSAIGAGTACGAPSRATRWPLWASPARPRGRPIYRGATTSYRCVNMSIFQLTASHLAEMVPPLSRPVASRPLLREQADKGSTGPGAPKGRIPVAIAFDDVPRHHASDA
jgi:hypothetical protein